MFPMDKVSVETMPARFAFAIHHRRKIHPLLIGEIDAAAPADEPIME
jgi:hypothetical protein